MTELKLYNNATVKLTDENVEDGTIKVSCPKLGSGELSNNTNSHFCKLQNIVDYKWQDVGLVNWLTVHRSLPLIAYVINPSYMKSLVRNTATDPAAQLIRILNYEDRTLGLCKRPFSAPIADIAFSYNSASRNQILIASVDFLGEVSVFAFDEKPQEINGRVQYEIQCLLVIHSSNLERTSSSMTLAWCPFVGFDDEESVEADEGDPGLKLAVASDETVELFSVDLLHANKQTYERSEIEEKNAYLQFETGASVIRISLSNDATAACCVSKDNSVNFLQLNVFRSDFELVHNWTPQLPFGHKIAYFHFLDDFNKLLEDSSYHFWGFAFIGTQNGELSIWDLKQWCAIQRIQIDVSEYEDSSLSFRYHVDVSSHLITAVYGNDAFIVQLTFDESNESPKPRVEKITRFQLYNRLLSFVGKQNSIENELNLFWMTKKSLERCVINGSQLSDESESDQNILISESRKTTDEANKSELKDSIRHKLLNDMSMNSTSQDNVSLTLSALFKNSASIAPSAITPSMQHSFGNTNSSIHPPPPPPPTSLLGDPKQFFIASQVEAHSIMNAKSSSPTSEEVQKLLNSVDIPIENPSNTENNVSVGEVEEEESVNWSGVQLTKKDINEFVQQISQAVERLREEHQGRNDELVQDLAVEQHLDVVQTRLLTEIDKIRALFTNEISKTNDEIQSVRRDVKDPNNFKVNTKVLDNFLRKMMDQLHTTLCKGMSELVTQVRSETDEVVDKLVKLNLQQASQMEAMQKHQSKLEGQFKEMTNKCNELMTKQQQFLVQLQNVRLPVLPSPAPSPMRNNKVLDPNSLFQNDRQMAEQKQRAEAIAMIWKQIRSNNGVAILNGFSAALDLKDEPLLTQILNVFASNPQGLIQHIKKDQAVLVSLLNQLTLHPLEKNPWKLKFISETIPLLDIRMPLVQSMLSLFIDKLIKKIRDLEKMGGEEHLLCTLLLTILDSYRKQLIH